MVINLVHALDDVHDAAGLLSPRPQELDYLPFPGPPVLDVALYLGSGLFDDRPMARVNENSAQAQDSGERCEVVVQILEDSRGFAQDTVTAEQD